MTQLLIQCPADYCEENNRDSKMAIPGQDRIKHHFPKMTFPKIGIGQNVIFQESGQDGQMTFRKSGQDRKRHFQLCKLDKVSLSGTTLCPKDSEILQSKSDLKYHQTLCLNADSPL